METKLLFTFLFMGVYVGTALGDVKCFLWNLAECSKKFGQNSIAATDLCEKYVEMFKCMREAKQKCGVSYNLDDTEAMYREICTNGTSLHEDFLKYQACILSSTQVHLTCFQDIADFAKRFKVIDEEALFEISKLACQERDSITNCLYDFIATDCGQGAKTFMEVVSVPSDKVNVLICKDIMDENEI